MPMPGTTPAATQPVRVEYVPKSQRKSGGAAPKPPPPRVEAMPAAVASEFADFDDGPARVTETVEGVVVGGDGADTTESVGGGGGGDARGKGSKKSKKAAGSRKRRNKSR